MSTNQENRHGLVWNNRTSLWDWPVDEETPEELAAAERETLENINLEGLLP